MESWSCRHQSPEKVLKCADHSNSMSLSLHLLHPLRSGSMMSMMSMMEEALGRMQTWIRDRKGTSGGSRGPLSRGEAGESLQGADSWLSQRPSHDSTTERVFPFQPPLSSPPPSSNSLSVPRILDASLSPRSPSSFSAHHTLSIVSSSCPLSLVFDLLSLIVSLALAGGSSEGRWLGLSALFLEWA